MQRLAVAGGVGGVDPAHAGVLASIAAIFGAALGAFGLWLANRMLGKAAFQTAINTGFKELTDQLQEERRLMREEQAAERLAAASAQAQLRGDIINLTQVIEGLKKILRENGIPVPAQYQAPTDFVVIPASESQK
jgi:hypothetical protein